MASNSPCATRSTRGPVVAAFFKISCPVCQYTFPFLERIYKAHGGKNVTIVGVSQNEKKDTAAFIKEYGVTFPVLLDDTDSYPVSNAYGLTNVPTIFWIAPDGEIEISSVGWERKEIEEINRKAAKINGNDAKASVPLRRASARLPRWLRIEELARGRGQEKLQERCVYRGRTRPIRQSFVPADAHPDAKQSRSL